ncbi:hypothetical protein PVL29_024425 [Vitis rotundifolia]|uniref:Uncharacterized protein n=1 Tax=Vitis rotundifolia TaxID=103349 RepID=A0AA38YRU4_VITRO|nr:hypothetical protein PVL29_024425 [Vitis rotundifolia]
MPFMSTAHFTISHHPSYLFADSPCTSFLTSMLPMSILSPKQLSYPDKPIIIPTAHALKPFLSPIIPTISHTYSHPPNPHTHFLSNFPSHPSFMSHAFRHVSNPHLSTISQYPLVHSSHHPFHLY